MHLNHPSSNKSPWAVRGKTVFHETSLWCQKSWGTARETTTGQKIVTGLPRQSPPMSKPDWCSSRGTPKSDLHSLPLPPALLFGPDTVRASGFSVSTVEWLSGPRGNSHRVQFPSSLSVVSPETPGRASSKQACAVTRVAGRTRGFDSQQSYMPLFFFFLLWWWKEQEEGERLQNRLPV